MSNQQIEDTDMPAEIDFSKGARGLHHIPPGARVLMPASIEKSVWAYFSAKSIPLRGGRTQRLAEKLRFPTTTL